MTSRRPANQIVALSIALVGLLAIALSMILRPGALVSRESDGVRYLAYSIPAVGDAVAYRGHLGVDSRGCVYFEVDDGHVRYRAAFYEVNKVTATGVTGDRGIFYAYGEPLVVGREYDPAFDRADRAFWPECDEDLRVFGMGSF